MLLNLANTMGVLGDEQKEEKLIICSSSSFSPHIPHFLISH
ncbi:hypothetical protein NSP_45110 [Nodularia spumigena CCY9414]|nr:hypothetical protein NSP_45110 [Nodularia spumigena CCY9414]